MVRKKELAEDLTQDTFIKVYRKLNLFKGESNLYTWVVQIARNTVFDYYRKNKIKEFFQFHKEEADYVTPQEILLKGEEVKRLYEAITNLKMEYKEVLILRKIKEFSIGETAEILGWNDVKVKNTTSRALAVLKKSLEEKEGDIHERLPKN